MAIVLLVGGVYNCLGACLLLASKPWRTAGAETVQLRAAHADHVQSKLFMSGAALTFGVMYFYLYFAPQYAMPFLLFGTFLKYWAFVASFIAWRRAGLARTVFLQFGVANLVIAVGFSAYLASRYAS